MPNDTSQREAGTDNSDAALMRKKYNDFNNRIKSTKLPAEVKARWVELKAKGVKVRMRCGGGR